VNPARRRISLKLQVFPDSAKKYRWRLVAGNGRTVASSGESFDSKSNARRAAQNFSQRASSAKFEIYADRGKKFRWRVVASNGQTIGSSGESFASRGSCGRSARNVRSKARRASLEELDKKPR
jgi:uncharacterized protein YegP (UPF0339 family)